MSVNGGIAGGVAAVLSSQTETDHNIEFYVVRILIAVVIIAIPACFVWMDWRKKRKK